MENKQKFNEIIKRIEAMKKEGSVDLSMEEDLSLAVMNLINLEEHLYFTGARTSNPEYYNMLNDIRAMRTELLAKLIDKHEGETWCICKHLLATSMRLMEVGTKLQKEEKKEEAAKFFDRAFEIYSMFWAIRLKIIDGGKFKKIAADESAQQAEKTQAWDYQDIVNKLVDCCDE